MSRLEIAVLLDEAVEHTLKTQKQLLEHKDAVSLMPIVRRLNNFAADLGKWRSGKFYLKDMSEQFLKEAAQIEEEADKVSEELWTYMPVPLVAICKEIRRVTRQAIEDKTFSKRLKDHYNNVRLRLLGQVAGARLLENPGDKGEEVERIFAQYLAQTLGTSVRVLRGGHIYDHNDNRSAHQIDIIVTPSDALAYCPADTDEGKYNVLIDQVLAAISVKTTLNPADLEQCWEEIQGIPEYAEKAEVYPHLAKEAWPLCLIVGAYTESLEKLKEKWNELRAKGGRRIPEMVLILDSGYMIPGDVSWPYRIYKDPRPDVRVIDGLAAGLGLGWLTTGIIARSTHLVPMQPTKWLLNLAIKLLHNERGRGVPASFEPRFNRFGWVCQPIHGVMHWGGRGVPVHNRLEVRTVLANSEDLTDPTRPAKQTGGWQLAPYEYRLFALGVVEVNGRFCALEEWINPRDKEHHRKRIAVFDSTTGQEVLDARFESLNSVSQLKQLDLSDLEIPALPADAR